MAHKWGFGVDVLLFTALSSGKQLMLASLFLLATKLEICVTGHWKYTQLCHSHTLTGMVHVGVKYTSLKKMIWTSPTYTLPWHNIVHRHICLLKLDFNSILRLRDFYY